MPRIFLSHSSNDNNEATALRQWLIDQRPELVNEIFLERCGCGTRSAAGPSANP